jgi:predicted PurR-regulated permease PerM
MMNALLEVWRNAYVRVVVGILGVCLAYLLLRQVSSVLIMVGLAYVLASSLHPLVVFLERKRVPRPVGLILAFTSVILLLGAITWLFSTIVGQLLEFSSQLPSLVQRFEQELGVRIEQLQRSPDQSPALRELIGQGIRALQEALSGIYDGLLSVLRGPNLIARIVGVLGGVLQFMLVLILGGYMLAGYEGLGRALLEVLPGRAQQPVQNFIRDVNLVVGGYIRGQVIVAALVGTMVGVGLAILGVPLALAIGFLSAIFNIVPYLGVVISIAPALLLAAPFGLGKLALVVLVFGLANQIEAQFLSPNILGRSTNLHPITIILAILCGAALGGMVGMLLAVPSAALGKLLIRRYWLNSRQYTETGAEASNAGSGSLKPDQRNGIRSLVAYRKRHRTRT